MPDMQHPDKQVEEFRRLCSETFKEEFTMQQAAEMAHRVLTLYELLARNLQDNEKNVVTPPNDPSRSS